MKSFVSALNEYFGRREGTSTLDFKREIDALTPKDRTELAAMLTVALGVEVGADNKTP